MSVKASEQRTAAVRRGLANLPPEKVWEAAAVASREWELVRRSSLSGPDKLAFLHLWAASELGGQLVSVKAASIAHDQGVTSDAGLKRLENLINAGAVRKRNHDKVRGQWLLEIVGFDELATLEIARRVEWDGQWTLFSLDPDEDATDGVDSQPCDDALAGAITRDPRPTVTSEAASGVASVNRDRGTSGGTSAGEPPRPTEEPPEEPRQEEPRSRNHDHNHDPARISKTIDHDPIPHENHKTIKWGRRTTSQSAGGATIDRGTSGGTSAGDRGSSGPVPFAALAQSLLANVRGEAEQMHAARKLRDAIVAEVADRNLNAEYVLKLCLLVVEGRAPLRDIAEGLDDLAKRQATHTLRKPRGAYFVGIAKRIFKEAGGAD